jgi:hypothetical protein
MAFIMLMIVGAPLCIFSFLWAKQIYIQHQMEEKLETAALKTIEIDNISFVWVKKGKEIVVNNKLFDIKTFTEKDGTTIFTGLYDSDETEIKKVLNNITQNETDKNNPTKLSLLKLAFSPMIKNDSFLEINIVLTTSKAHYSVFKAYPIKQLISVATPPPLV